MLDTEFVDDLHWDSQYRRLIELESTGITLPYSPSQGPGCRCPVCHPKLYKQADLTTRSEMRYDALAKELCK